MVSHFPRVVSLLLDEADLRLLEDSLFLVAGLLNQAVDLRFLTMDALVFHEAVKVADLRGRPKVAGLPARKPKAVGSHGPTKAPVDLHSPVVPLTRNATAVLRHLPKDRVLWFVELQVA